MFPPLLILNGLAMQHVLQRKTLLSVLPFTGPVGEKEAKAKVSETTLYIQKTPQTCNINTSGHVFLDEIIFALHSFLEDRERCDQSNNTDESVISTR